MPARPFEEDDMRSIRSIVVLAFVSLSLCVAAAEAQDHSDPRDAYFRAVASHFDLPMTEIVILGDWELAPDEIPVVLFVASRAGVSPEALVALRSSGRSWKELAGRYGIGAATLHMPLGARGSAGRLASVYERYGSVPVEEWSSIALTDQEIVALVNVRVLSGALGIRPEEILGRAGPSGSFVDLYQRLIG